MFISIGEQNRSPPMASIYVEAHGSRVEDPLRHVRAL